MEYSAAVTYVESLGKFGIHLGMDRIQGLTALLDHPERKIRTIHVTGTNGKGSVTTFLANMLQQAGKKVGSYTSPHFVRYNERICLNGEEISNEDFAAVTERTKAALDRFLAEGGEQPTQFEFITAMAFLYFAEKQVDYAVIEVGMGGLWDSTNIITPEVSVITNVTLEHTDRLGKTIEAIATQKAGIIKPGVPVLIGENDPEIEPVFRAKAAREGAPLYFTDHGIRLEDYPCPLEGDYQRFNIATVVAACGILRESWKLDPQTVRRGLARVVDNTHLQGRWQVLSRRPLVVCDTGHNVNGIGEIVRQLSHTPKGRLFMVFGMVNDKDVDGVLALLPKEAQYCFAQASVQRALDSRELARRAARFSLRGEAYPDCESAFRAAQQQAGPQDMIFVGGSTFVVADVLEALSKQE